MRKKHQSGRLSRLLVAFLIARGVPKDVLSPPKKINVMMDMARVYLNSNEVGYSQKQRIKLIEILQNELGPWFPKRQPKPAGNIVPFPRTSAYTPSDEFFKTKAWLSIRYKTLQKFGRRCMACGLTRKDGAIIQVDHIKPRSKYPELSLDPNNLQVLCKDCNMGKSNTDETDWRSMAHEG